MISATEADWSREKPLPGQYEPGKKLLAALRRYQRLRAESTPFGKLLRPFVVLQHRFWSAVSGADIPLTTKIGGGPTIHRCSGAGCRAASSAQPRAPLNWGKGGTIT